MIMYSTEGGMDIEKVAEETPDLIFYENIDPILGLQSFQARKIAFNLGLSGNAFKEMTKFVQSLYTAYIGIDASLFEINFSLTISTANFTADFAVLFPERVCKIQSLLFSTVNSTSCISL